MMNHGGTTRRNSIAHRYYVVVDNVECGVWIASEALPSDVDGAFILIEIRRLAGIVDLSHSFARIEDRSVSDEAIFDRHESLSNR
jgi:hypothetical protein